MSIGVPRVRIFSLQILKYLTPPIHMCSIPSTSISVVTMCTILYKVIVSSTFIHFIFSNDLRPTIYEPRIVTLASLIPRKTVTPPFKNGQFKKVVEKKEIAPIRCSTKTHFKPLNRNHHRYNLKQNRKSFNRMKTV